MNPFYEGKIREKKKSYTSANSPRLGDINIRF